MRFPKLLIRANSRWREDDVLFSFLFCTYIIENVYKSDCQDFWEDFRGLKREYIYIIIQRQPSTEYKFPYLRWFAIFVFHTRSTPLCIIRIKVVVVVVDSSPIPLTRVGWEFLWRHIGRFEFHETPARILSRPRVHAFPLYLLFRFSSLCINSTVRRTRTLGAQSPGAYGKFSRFREVFGFFDNPISAECAVEKKKKIRSYCVL